MMKTLIFLGMICLTVMFGLKLSGRLPNESLAVENETVTAKLLPLDAKTFDKDYETATFGIG